MIRQRDWWENRRRKDSVKRYFVVDSDSRISGAVELIVRSLEGLHGYGTEEAPEKGGVVYVAQDVGVKIYAIPIEESRQALVAILGEGNIDRIARRLGRIPALELSQPMTRDELEKAAKAQILIAGAASQLIGVT